MCGYQFITQGNNLVSGELCESNRIHHGSLPMCNKVIFNISDKDKLSIASCNLNMVKCNHDSLGVQLSMDHVLLTNCGLRDLNPAPAKQCRNI